MGTEFVEDWVIVNTLGEGAFGEVKLLVNKSTGDAVAMKMVDVNKHPDAVESVRKEVVIHRMLNHPHIIKYYGHRKENCRQYIFLEYASGGELFDRIEVDFGMHDWEAQKYMRQLLSGVEYLHRKGIAHRDLKPENLLLDAGDNLKISDFGMATVFRIHGMERVLDTRCGTLPYVAPEILSPPYRAQPADVWSCGIILVAMLGGELPWDKPTVDCYEYKKFREEKYPSITPWTKLDNIALSLVYTILKAAPDSRATLEQISKSRWMCTEFSKSGKREKNEQKVNLMKKMRKCSDDTHSNDTVEDSTRVCRSQPDQYSSKNINVEDASKLSDNIDGFCFSQPTHIDDLLLCTQLQLTRSQATQNNLQKFVKRMTRFFVSTDRETTIQTLCGVLDKQGCKWILNSTAVLTISAMDTRNMQLSFKAHVLDMDGKVLVEFRRSKGCGLEFKKCFLKIRENLKHVLVQGTNTDNWPFTH